jgi:hypothetical protein
MSWYIDKIAGGTESDWQTFVTVKKLLTKISRQETSNETLNSFSEAIKIHLEKVPAYANELPPYDELIAEAIQIFEKGQARRLASGQSTPKAVEEPIKEAIKVTKEEKKKNKQSKASVQENVTIITEEREEKPTAGEQGDESDHEETKDDNQNTKSSDQGAEEFATIKVIAPTTDKEDEEVDMEITHKATGKTRNVNVNEVKTNVDMEKYGDSFF